VVYASSLAGIQRAGVQQIAMTAQQVVAAAPFFKGFLLGGVLADETDRIFKEREKE
jgi:hypothetical protein